MPDNIVSRKSLFLQAVLLVVGGYLAFSIADLCSKILQETYNIHQLLATSGTFGSIVTGTWLLARYGVRAFLPSNVVMHLFRAASVVATAYFMVRSLQTLPLADFYGLIFITPFIVMVLAVPFLKESIGWRRWAAAMVGFTGILVLAGPQFNHIGEGVVCALLGAFFAAVNIVMLKKIGTGAPLPLYGFYAFAMMGSFNIAALLLNGAFLPYDAAHLPVFMVHGPMVLLGLLSISIGFAKAPESVVVAPFQYTQIIWGVFFGWAFYHAMPTATTWIGLSLVIGAGLYSLRREYARAHHLD